jgi:hypothetical protein
MPFIRGSPNGDYKVYGLLRFDAYGNITIFRRTASFFMAKSKPTKQPEWRQAQFSIVGFEVPTAAKKKGAFF